MVSTNISHTHFFFFNILVYATKATAEQCVVLNKRTFRVCSAPSSTMIGFSFAPPPPIPHTLIHPSLLSSTFRLHRSAPGARWRTRTVSAGLTGTHADRQSRESRVRKTSALHWKVPVPSRSSSQLFRLGEMSFTQMACRE